MCATDLEENYKAEMTCLVATKARYHQNKFGKIPGTEEFIAHRLFTSVQQLQETLEELLNARGLVINWNRKIKNKGNKLIAALDVCQLNTI